MKKQTYLLVLLLLLSGYRLTAQSGTIRINHEQRSLVAVLEIIARQSRHHVVYSNDVVTDSMTVSVAAGEYPIDELLDNILPQHDLFYRELSDKTLVVSNLKLHGMQPTQAKGIRIRGNVRDSADRPLAFASVGLYTADRFLTGSTADRQGHFSLRYAFDAGQSYTVKVTSIGFQPVEFVFVYPDTARLAAITLKRDNRLLAEVQVQAKRPPVERRADRFIVNVEGSVLETGSNGLEILQKSPGLWVDPNGNISLRGQSVMVMINDVVQRMSATDLAEYLRTLRSEDIAKIEILPNPPAEFEAEGSGGIVHIVLKRGRDEGFTGTLNTQYRQQVDRPAYNMGATFNYKIRSLYVFGTGGYGKDRSSYIATNDIRYPDQHAYNSFTNRENNNTQAMLRLGAIYEFRANQSIGLQTNLNRGKLLQRFDTDIALIDPQRVTEGSATSDWTRTPGLNSATLNYSWKTDSLGSGLKVLADYLGSENPNTNEFHSRYTDPERDAVFRNATPSTTRLYSVQTDYNQWLDATQLKAGLKFTNTDRDNEVIRELFESGQWLLDPGRSNRFRYQEQLLMGYAALERQFKRFSAQIGLRAEQTIMDGNSVSADIRFRRSYVNLFPSVFLLHRLDSAGKKSLVLNYTRRLSRPSFAALNPYRLQFYDFLAQIGNPDLLPEYTDRMEAGITLAGGLSCDVYYATTSNTMAQYAETVNKMIEYQIRNFGSSHLIGTSMYLPVKVRPWWSTTNNLNLYYLRYQIAEADYRNTSFNISTYQVFTIKKIGDADVFAFYRSPYLTANSDMADYCSVDIGFTKRLWNNKARLRLNVTDIFNTAREREVTQDPGATVYFYQKRPTRTVGLSFSYTFTAGKTFSNRRIEQSAEEEQKRIGN
ncbi:outer membrane beta-barrel protein [Parapedobacter sp. GCM10030251]|uniref:outer membrane beta-barrel protein n=1 Tax=Parapedobacter sp. GCM10030251 TaxID=3273419 RepID=UPI00360A19AD